MASNGVNKVADDLVELAGGYNRRAFCVLVLIALALGFLLGGLLGIQCGIYFLLLPVLVCLVAVGLMLFLKFRQSREGQSQDSPGAVLHPSPPVAPTPAPPTAPAPVLSPLEQQVMERLARTEESLSVSGLAAELGQSENTIRAAIENLANRGLISLE